MPIFRMEITYEVFYGIGRDSDLKRYDPSADPDNPYSPRRVCTIQITANSQKEALEKALARRREADLEQRIYPNDVREWTACEMQ